MNQLTIDQLQTFLTGLPIVSLSILRTVVIVPSADADLTIVRMKTAGFYNKAAVGVSYPDLVFFGDRFFVIGDSTAYNNWLEKLRSTRKTDIDRALFRFFNYVSKELNPIQPNAP